MPSAERASEALRGLTIFTSGMSGGVTVHGVPASGKPILEELQRVACAQGTTAVEWVLRHPKHSRLYAFCSFWKPGTKVKFSDAREGELLVFEIGPNGRLSEGNTLRTGGRQPCAAALSPDGALLAVAHYLDGRLCLLPLDAGEPIAQRAQVVRLPFKGNPIADEDRLLNGISGPLCHGVNFSPSGRWVLACDAGQGRIVVIRADNPHEEPRVIDVSTQTIDGNGLQRRIVKRVGVRPRHLAFHPSGCFIYVLYECANRITVHTFDEATGAVGAALQELSALSPHKTTTCFPCRAGGLKIPAEIEVREDGRLLVVSTRGIFTGSSLSAFAVASDGTLSWLATTPALGRLPRHFVFQGNSLIVAMEFTKSLAVFDTQEGLTPIGAVPLQGAKHGAMCVQTFCASGA